jgi:citrate lyase subunit beta/citryl-CoA lyase
MTSSLRDLLATARTLLFVPGNRPDRFDKAAASGADLVVLDLEDAVGPADKYSARDNVRAWLDAGHDAVVRINAAGTPWHGADVTTLADQPRAIMLPKAERPSDISALINRLSGGATVIPLIETALGVLDAHQICSAPAVVRPAFGNIDLAAQLGVDHSSHQALFTARSSLVLAAASAGCAPPIDGVTTATDDADAVAHDTRHARTLGFTGKLCIHPRQIAAVHAAFAPTEEELTWARNILDAAADGSVVAHHGHMIDRPVVLRAHQIIVRATRP